MPSRPQKRNAGDLLAIGLEDAACWQVDGKKLKHVGDKSANWRRLTAIPNCFYAFCCGDDVFYIGKTTKILAKRFTGYCDLCNGRATNWKCHQKIRALLHADKSIRILVLPSHSHLSWGGFEINLAAGLEDALVKAFTPPWNGSNKHLLTETTTNEEEINEKP